jgi:replicative DNA helicase
MALQHMKQTERPLVYYSYEVPTERMLLKAMMILEGIQYSKIPHENETMYRTKLLNGQLPQWDYIKGILNNRLFLTDSNDEIETIYQSLDRPKFDGALIYLDYLQLIPIDGRNARYEKLQKISNTLRELANKRNMVIMTGSQIVDGETPLQDQAREAKDIEQASELVLRVWNKTVAEARGAYKIVKDKETKEDEIKHYYDEVDGDFVVHVLKNRNGEPGKKFGFNLKQGVKLDLVTAESTKNKLSF